jgi:hypothetical protein
MGDVRNSDKKTVTVIGDSNVRNTGKLFQSQITDSTVIVRPGAKVEHIAKDLHNLIDPTCDEVVIHIGSSNVVSGEHIASVIIKYGQLISKMSSDFPDKQINICSIPPSKHSGWNDTVSRMNIFLKHKCTGLVNVHFIDTNISQDCIKNDLVHISDKGKKQMSSAVLKAVCNRNGFFQGTWEPTIT